VHDPFRDALVVEVEDLLAEVEILERGGTAFTDAQGVLVVGDGNTVASGERGMRGVGLLVGLAAVAASVSVVARVHE
jgi:hypothetical protein